MAVIFHERKKFDNCHICGRPTRMDGERWWVHMTTSHKFVPRDYAGEDSQGSFLIGNDCRKKFPGLAYKFDYYKHFGRVRVID